MSASRIWVGCYTDDLNGSGEGIALLTVAADGSLENRGVAAAADSPSYLVRAGELIYAAGEGAGVVSAYRVSGSELHFLGLKDTAGELPCGLAVLGDVHDDVRGDVPGDRSALAVACYGDGSVDVHPLGPGGAIQDTGQSLHGRDRGSVDKDSVGKDSAGKESAVDKGSVGRQPRVEQDGPHAHAVLEVDATTVLTTDLGTDDVYIHSREGAFPDSYRVGAASHRFGTARPDAASVGVVWVLAELSRELFVLARGADGFEVVGSIALPGAEEGDHASAVALGVDGRFAYAGLRGSDNVSVLAASPDGLTLTPVGFVGSGGGWPRHLVVDGGLLRVANQLTNSVVTFSIGDDGIPVRQSSLMVHSPTYLLLD